MDLEHYFHMKDGDVETSYANHSMLQRTMIRMAKPILEECVVDGYCRLLPECFMVADLGCAAGPNTLLVLSEIVDVIALTCEKLGLKPPCLQAFLNDLYGNDFNSVLKSLPGFYKGVEEEHGRRFGSCFVSATPGSFYGRLFPDNSLHFVHSSSAIMWLSKEGNEDFGRSWSLLGEEGGGGTGGGGGSGEGGGFGSAWWRHDRRRRQTEKCNGYYDDPTADDNVREAKEEDERRRGGERPTDISVAGATMDIGDDDTPKKASFRISKDGEKVPKRLVGDGGEIVNKGNICVAKTSPPTVHQTYFELFRGDFTSFLRSRAQELVPGGSMMLTTHGSINSNDPLTIYEPIGLILNDMVREGLIEEQELDSFDVPYYTATEEEVRKVVEEEGSFTLESLESMKMDWDGYIKKGDKHERAKILSDTMRAVGEPILAAHFGEAVMDELFRRFQGLVLDYMAAHKCQFVNLVMRLTNKA